MPVDQLETTQEVHKYLLRLPMPLHERVKAYAREWGISYNAAVAILTRQALDAQK